MAGLLGLEDDPASQGLLSLGLRLMSTPGNFMSALGTSGLGAMGDLNSAAQAKQRRDLLAQEQRVREQQMQIQAQAMKQAQAEQQRQEAIRQAYAGAMRSPEQQAMGQFGGPTQAAANAAPGMMPQVDQAALIRSLSQVDPMTAYQMLQPKAKKLSKLEPMRGPDGKMINVAVYEDGTTSVLPYGVRPDIALQNLGNRVQAIDKNDTSGGQSFAMGQSPDSAASNAVTMRGQNMTRDTAAARLAFDSKKPTSSAAPTEDERKAAGWLAQADNAWKNMRAVAFDKDGKIADAAKPGLLDAWAAIPSMGATEGAANMLRSPARRQFIQASGSLSEALLRAATGAGVNRDEAAQKVRELTPVFGEDSETTKQKMDAIPMYLESLNTRAGRASAPGYKPAGVPGSTQRNITVDW